MWAFPKNKLQTLFHACAVSRRFCAVTHNVCGMTWNTGYTASVWYSSKRAYGVRSHKYADRTEGNRNPSNLSAWKQTQWYAIRELIELQTWCEPEVDLQLWIPPPGSEVSEACGAHTGGSLIDE